MLHFIINKIAQKRWMVCSLFFGSIFFISLAALNPIYMHGALQNMLTDRMAASGATSGRYPMLMQYEKNVSFYEQKPEECIQKQEQSILKHLQGIEAATLMDVRVYEIAPQNYLSNMKETNHGIYQIGFAAMPEIEQHIEIVSGEGFSEDSDNDGVIRVIVSQSAFQKGKMVIGERLTTESLTDQKGNPLCFEIAGVFCQSDMQDPYWVDSADSYERFCFVSEHAFHSLIAPTLADDEGSAFVKLLYWRLYAYEDIKYEDAQDIYQSSLKAGDSGWKISFQTVLEQYLEDIHKVETTMNILQLPTLILLTLFIYMVAAKMLAMEQNEISVLKSRGVSGLQILGVYFMQSTLICVPAAAFGLVLGCGFSKIVGLSNSFMEFVNRKTLSIALTQRVWAWLILSCIFCILVMTLPVIPKCRITIVEQKRHKRDKKVFWKKLYLDVIGLAVSGYLFYSYNSQIDNIRQRVRMGEGVDPTLFLGSSLFILSASLFLTRLIPWLIQLLYMIGKKRWGVSSYTAFLQSIRNRDKQSFMMIFLVATVALGIFNANTARTINTNEETNLRYEDGADLVLQEVFEDNVAAIKYAMTHGDDNPGPVVYSEPESIKYQAIEQDIDAMTKVYHINNVKVTDTQDFTGNGGRTAPKIDLPKESVTLMGIHTKEFGETAYMPRYVSSRHWYYLLNKMAENPYGVLVSSNMQKEFGLKEGDCILYTLYDELGRDAGFGKGVIVGFVDYFPSYISTDYVQNADGSYTPQNRYLIVVSFDMVTSVFGVQPYERWIKNKNGNDYIYRFLDETPYKLLSFVDSNNDIVHMKNDPIFQETNGLLTIGFLVSLLICGAGFLIFQVMSIKERELNFGVYRAMGLTRKELKQMLFLEQIFTTLPAVLGGIVTGMLATVFYVPLIDAAYASGTAKILPARIITSANDMLQLSLILLLTFSLCMWIITRIISHMQIAQALKLGED